MKWIILSILNHGKKPFQNDPVKATLPCYCPHQLSLFVTKEYVPGRHNWKNGICIDCGMKKSKSVVRVCDCGCKTPINTDTLTTHYGKLTFVFGHETLNIFDDVKIVSSKVMERRKKYKNKRKKHKKRVTTQAS